jgi:hypothetical protein
MAALRKATSVDKARCSTSSHDDQNDLSENLADMIQRVNSKIEKLIESTPKDSDQLPNKIEEPFCEGHSSDSESGHSSHSEPDPEEPSPPNVERKEIDSLYDISFEELLATCNALLRENQSLKMELAAVKAQKTMNEIDTQPNDAQSLLKQNEILTWSSSVKELTSPAPALALPITSRTAMVSSSKGKFPGKSQSVDVDSLSARHPAARASANSEGASCPPQSPELLFSACTPLEQSHASPVPDSVIRYPSAPSVWEMEEYVQYHKEPMAGGWREFYTPRSMHTPSAKSSRWCEFYTPRSMHTPSAKSSRRGSKSVHVYRRHSASGLALERSLSWVEDC